MIKEDFLLKLDSKKKVRKVKVELSEDSTFYYIKRTTGLLSGKEVPQPTIRINVGRAGRTAKEQAELQYNAFVKEYKDKGYQSVSNKEITEEEAKKLLGDETTDQAGVPKPMLAKLSDQCDKSIWDKDWYVSRKLNGVRCMLYYKDGEVHSASRGGGTYDIGIQHIRTNPSVLKIFQENPDIILDGEIYRHGIDWPLQRISGLARLQERKTDCDLLEYWVYDFVDKNKPFKERWEKLEQIKGLIANDAPIKILDQVVLEGYARIKAEHDKYVKEGFEGLCARNPESGYGINTRSANFLVKMKERKDDEATIIDVKEGLRPEDMSFILKTKTGIEFAAKPMGNIDTRIEYLTNKEKYIGKQMTYTYFELSSDGVPCQPVAVHIRPNDE